MHCEKSPELEQPPSFMDASKAAKRDSNGQQMTGIIWPCTLVYHNYFGESCCRACSAETGLHVCLEGLKKKYVSRGMQSSRFLRLTACWINLNLACRGISFETPQKVRKQWAQEHGVPWYVTEEYCQALAETCSRYAVTLSEFCSLQDGSSLGGSSNQ